MSDTLAQDQPAQIGNIWHPSRNYDPIAPIDEFAPGVVLQREVQDAVYVAYQDNNFHPLTAAEVVAGLQVAPPSDFPVFGSNTNVPTLPVVFPVTLPAFPTGLPRFADSNPASDGWSIDNPDACFT